MIIIDCAASDTPLESTRNSHEELSPRDERVESQIFEKSQGEAI